ncbi:hypothetical protein IAT38_000141 [Cryptococcus sp. DSM 104549]
MSTQNTSHRSSQVSEAANAIATFSKPQQGERGAPQVSRVVFLPSLQPPKFLPSFPPSFPPSLLWPAALRDGRRTT